MEFLEVGAEDCDDGLASMSANISETASKNSNSEKDSADLTVFSCDSSSISHNVGLSVCRSVGRRHLARSS